MEKQREKILAAMRNEPERVWLVKEFQGGQHFVGYEAGTRIGDLVRLGLVEKVPLPGKFMGYRYVKEPKPPLKVEPEETERKPTKEEIEAFAVGILEGLSRHTWMKDGVTYVGNGTYTYKQAREMLDRDYPHLVEYFNK